MLVRTRSAALVLAAAILLGSPSLAQHALVPAERRHVETTPQGTVVVVERTLAEPGATAPELSAPGVAWTRADNGANWIPYGVTIGDRAGQVFSGYGLNNGAAELLSTFDSNPPTPVYSDPQPLVDFSLASADATDVHVLIQSLTFGMNQLRKYSSAGAPDWVYTFTAPAYYSPWVGISRDGQTIVAATDGQWSGYTIIARFEPGSNAPVSYTQFPVGPNEALREFDLSADGSTLYFSTGLVGHFFDVATETVFFSMPLSTIVNTHGISGDGSVIAWGGDNAMRVYERNGNSYVLTHTETLAGPCYCGALDISDDSSTIAFAWGFFDQHLKVQVNALDVPSKQLTMTNVALGAGFLQNVPSDVSISADGSRFAVGVWGDQAGLVPEARVFSRSSDTPIASLDLPGSVFDLELSADGQKLVTGSKAVHANISGYGGRVDLLDLGGEDFVLRGAPRSGATVAFDTYATPGQHALVLQALRATPTPNLFPGVGTLYLDRNSLTFLPPVLVPAGGVATTSYTITNDPAWIGRTLWFQGYSALPRQLTHDWIQMSILP